MQALDMWDSFPLFQLLNDYLRIDGEVWEGERGEGGERGEEGESDGRGRGERGGGRGGVMQALDTWDSFPLFQLLNDYFRSDGETRGEGS